MSRLCLRRSCSYITELQTKIPIVRDAMHAKLCTQKGHPYLSQEELRVVLNISRPESRIASQHLYGRHNTSLRPRLLKSVWDLRFENENSTYIPLGTLLSNDFLEWFGGCFDGDGCVTTRGQTPRICLVQNSLHVKLLHESFGGVLGVQEEMHRWEVNGLKSYFVAKVLIRNSFKKKEELLEVIKFHENEITFSDMHSNIRKLKNEYHEKEYDVGDWSYARLAGWIDSDGSIGIKLSNKKNKTHFYPRVLVCQNNASLCFSLKKRFGGSFHDQKTQWVWSVTGVKAMALLSNISPYLIHKKSQCEILLSADNMENAHEQISNLNAKNNANARRWMVKRSSNS